MLITTMVPEKMNRYLGFAQMLRQDAINTEVYLEAALFKVQMRHAEQKGIKIVLIANEKELADDRVTIKNLRSGGHLSVHTALLVQNVHDQIEAPDP